MERIELLSGHVTIEKPRNVEGVGYNLTFEVKQDSVSDNELAQYFSSGELFPFTYGEEPLAVSLCSQTDRGASRIYRGTAGFLRPGMGSGGG